MTCHLWRVKSDVPLSALPKNGMPFTVLWVSEPPAAPHVKQFMREIAEHLDADGPTELFAKLVEQDAIPTTSQRKFMKWWGGHNAPEHEPTLAMLRAAGMIEPPSLTTLETFVRRLAEDPQSVPDEEIQSVAAAASELALLLERVAAALASRQSGSNAAGLA